eukprot:CAMPEP_0206429972 /NCGR_PEP_ID=MMETSP0324_2-20121206/6548_1 /ASSEMBLY_ACC=CAM_ASM_000836 /TAXON_ID=2866 /ORGANISM="Crypthecodinium cohnii, Strain Seligo" /LENGTH=483 /DNA_ID=CAMNT_0053895733 /DNA_START=21 /DNA_END=1472 /DNA_ORIENTATION=+
MTRDSSTQGMMPAYALFAFTLWQSFCSSGIVYGWPLLMLLLKQEGVYASRCPQGVEECSSRDVALNLVFTAGAMCNILGGVIGGPISSPKVALGLGVVLTTLGSLLLALAPSNSEFLWPLAYIFQGLGGGIVHFGAMSLGNVFGKNRGWIMACLAGVLGLSTFVYQIFYAFYTAGMSRQAVFLLHSGIMVLNLLGTLWLWPMRPFRAGETVGFQHGRMVALNGISMGANAANKARISCKTVLKFAIAPKFVGFVCFLATQLWLSRCLMGMFGAELAWKNRILEDMGSAPISVSKHLTLFTMSQAVMGLTVIPVFGTIAAKYGHIGAPAFATGLLSVVWLACLCIPAEWPLYILYIFAGWHRQFFFSTFLNFMTSEYAPEVYGRLLTITNLMSGFVVLVQNPMLAFILNSLDGNFWPMLAFMLALASLLTAIAGWCLLQERRALKNSKDQKAKDSDAYDSEESISNEDLAENTESSDRSIENAA